jgi:tetratricopeptide (TPR) repeat protein
MQMNKPDAALDCFQKASAAQPSYAPAHNALGEFLAYQRQDLSSAWPHFLNALRLDPDDLAALNNLGNVEMAAANNGEARRYFRRVLELDPKFVPAYGNLAIMSSAQGRNTEA